MHKECVVCNKQFTRPNGYSQKQWLNRTTCSRKCSAKRTATLLKGTKQSEETRQKKSVAQKLKWQDSEERAKRTKAITRKMHTKAYKEHHKASLRKYFDNPDNKQAIKERVNKAVKTKFVPNTHRARGSVTYIYAENQKGVKSPIKVDTADYEALKGYRWVMQNTGYAEATINSKRVLMHRMLLKPEGRKQVDHINGFKNDNRRANLRTVTPAQQSYNKKRGRMNTSGCKGVTYSKDAKKWRSVIWKNHKRYHLGYFDDIKQASQAYNNAAIKLHGEHASLNK